MTSLKSVSLHYFTVQIASWYGNIDKLSLLAYKVTQLGGTEEVTMGNHV